MLPGETGSFRASPLPPVMGMGGHQPNGHAAAHQPNGHGPPHHHPNDLEGADDYFGQWDSPMASPTKAGEMNQGWGRFFESLMLLGPSVQFEPSTVFGQSVSYCLDLQYLSFNANCNLFSTRRGDPSQGYGDPYRQGPAGPRRRHMNGRLPRGPPGTILTVEHVGFEHVVLKHVTLTFDYTQGVQTKT